MGTRTVIVTLFGVLFVALAVAQMRDPLQEQKRGAVSEDEYVMPEERHLIQSLEGQALFHAYCATCHGSEALGNGPAASALKTPPADLTRISMRNGGTFPFTQVEKTISGEERDVTSHGSREMPMWGPIFGQIAWDQDLGTLRIYKLTKYLESLQKKPFPGRFPATPLGR
jgi:mono/diheme cytochrome c family protein